jgi:2-haloacid dehalogenase
VADRWATFDCYGTLVDWETGIGDELGRLWPEARRDGLLRRYHQVEPDVERDDPTASYREVMARALQDVARVEGLPLDDADRDALAIALPAWPVFPEVPRALRIARRHGWRLGILSNTDPDLLAASIVALGVQPDLAVTAAEAGSYKPAPGHWLAFRERTGADPARHVHVAASLFHDIEPAAALGIPAIWINRLGERSDLPRAAELRDLTELSGALDAVVAAAP